MDLVRRPIGRLLEGGDLAEHLFPALAPDREARCDVYGYGSQDIDADLGLLSEELLRLSRTGKCDRDVMSGGEEVLQRLIRGLLSVEWEAKDDVNPKNAEEIARAFRSMKVEHDPDAPITPDEIDSMQASAIFAYQASRYCREALQQILDAVGRINRSLDRGEPGQARVPAR